MPQTMFERYGGFGVVSKMVLAFYDRVLDSELLAPYFEGVDMRGLIDHQTKFISQVMGGPAAYSDQMLEAMHAPKRITTQAFDEMIAVLTETLEDFEMDEEDIEALIGQMELRRSIIVTAEGTRRVEGA